jgi:hypothetical protein
MKNPISENRPGRKPGALIDATGARSVLTLLALLFAAAPVWAHPGHDWLEHGASHLVTSPFHLLVLAGAGLGLGVAAKFVRSASARAYLYLGATVCLMAAAALTLIR